MTCSLDILQTLGFFFLFFFLGDETSREDADRHVTRNKTKQRTSLIPSYTFQAFYIRMCIRASARVLEKYFSHHEIYKCFVFLFVCFFKTLQTCLEYDPAQDCECRRRTFHRVSDVAIAISSAHFQHRNILNTTWSKAALIPAVFPPPGKFTTRTAFCANGWGGS